MLDRAASLAPARVVQRTAVMPYRARPSRQEIAPRPAARNSMAQLHTLGFALIVGIFAFFALLLLAIFAAL